MGFFFFGHPSEPPSAVGFIRNDEAVKAKDFELFVQLRITGETSGADGMAVYDQSPPSP